LGTSACLPGEPVTAYRAYRIYRNLGPRRTLAKAWRSHRRIRPRKKQRGRPRVKSSAERPISGQWTAWSSTWSWPERAAAHDAQCDVQQRQAGLNEVQQLEDRRLTLELSAQDHFEKMVREGEARLDRMAKLPIASYSHRKRQIDGRTVVVLNDTRVIGIDLVAYARLLQSINETARWAIIGLRGKADKRQIRNNFTADPDCNNEGMDRLPAESQRAFHAFCKYRNQGPDRSIAAAWAADHPTLESASTALKGQRTRPAGHWAEWSTRYNWVSRAAAYDAMVASAQRRSERYRREKLEDRRDDFELTNQDRLETRSDKIWALLLSCRDVPALDVTINSVTRYSSGRTVRESTHSPTLDLWGLAAVSKQYRETMRQAVVGLRGHE
jgi:hypothetical protein